MEEVMIKLMMALGMFGVVCFADIVWTWWTRACNESKTVQAMVASVLIYLLGGVSIMGYTTAPWLLLPACVGAAVGTWIGMRWKL
jgi:hypothetical protein